MKRMWTILTAALVSVVLVIQAVSGLRQLSAVAAIIANEGNIAPFLLFALKGVYSGIGAIAMIPLLAIRKIGEDKKLFIPFVVLLMFLVLGDTFVSILIDAIVLGAFAVSSISVLATNEVSGQKI